MKAKIAEWKKETVDELKNLVKQYNVFGIADMTNLPTLQLQRIKHKLKDKIVLRMTKGRLIKIALDQLKAEKKGIEKLEEHVHGMPALILTKESPFKLAKVLQKNKSNAPAKAGQKAPKDLIIPAGPTPFAPGPIIGELGQLGIKTEVKEGKVAVKDDSLVAKKGEEIKPKVAEVLTRLGIEPMEVGLNILALYEDGIVYSGDVLDINEKDYIDEIKRIYMEGINLSMAIGYVTKENVSLMIKKASLEVNALNNLDKIKILEKTEEKVTEKVEEKPEEVPEEKEFPVEEKPEEVKEETSVEEKAEEIKEEVPVEEKKEEQPIEKEPEKEPEEKQEEEEKPQEEKQEEPKEEKPEEEPKEEKTEEPQKEEKHYDKGGKELEDKEVQKMKEVEQLARDIMDGKRVVGG